MKPIDGLIHGEAWALIDEINRRYAAPLAEDAEFLYRLAEARSELFNLRFQLATNQLDNTARLTEVRRDIARIRTVLAERQSEEESKS